MRNIKEEIKEERDCESIDNPYQEGDKWYWYDESYTSFGPFNTRKEADGAMQEYVHMLYEGLLHGFRNEEGDIYED